ncbi:uridine kinase [Nocardioides mesophilus]|uniref:Uridine kinase n=1 Tax=Nocardioides mesophilus TaxID=433659 RepID=A0A7G9RAV8_9ACTN|nr:uridine kinase [Nocardioides mesophilus]QNN52733.1 uridine kinase [Nocardioides mesophilus]
MPDLASIVDATPCGQRVVLVAVDGVDGSGKTTFAGLLAAEYLNRGRVALVVHMDDFLNPRAIRYRRGRTSPDGFFLDTYDLGTFAANVLEPLAPGGDRAVVARAFDLHADGPVADDPVVVPPGAVVIVEGMFLHRDELVTRWDLSVFLDVPFTVTASRMARRDGSNPDPEHPSMSRYVGGQRLYLDSCRPADRATFVIDNFDEG